MARGLHPAAAAASAESRSRPTPFPLVASVTSLVDSHLSGDDSGTREAYLSIMPSHLRLAAPGRVEHDATRETEPIRLVLADDHAMVRRTMRSLLQDERDVILSAEASDLSSAFVQLDLQSPHVLVLDLRVASRSTVETIRRLRAHAPNTQIVVLTMEDSPEFARQALRAGALGFVLKDRADSDLVAAVRLAARGEQYVSPRVSAALEALRGGATSNELTPREVEIVRLIALGYTSREIASKLQLSRRTVETNRSRIHAKLGVATRAELVRFALSRHLVE